jgi:hypothetical protein
VKQPRLTIVVCILATLALASGCEKHEEPTAAAPAPQSTPTPAPVAQAPSLPAPTTAAATPEVTTAPASTTASAPVATPTVVATADGETPGVKADVTELKRNSGNTVTLKFTLINGSDQQVHLSGGDYTSGDNKFSTISGVYLLDAANKKKYLVVRDADDHCVCSTDLKNLDPKASITLWAKFPAPPLDVQKVSISIPHFSPIDDVPISQ